MPQAGPLEVRLLPSADVLTYHEDNTRSGWDPNETVLNPIDVNAASFGKLFNMPVDGKVDAQPLYMAGVNIPGQGVHNVVYVATEHDSVYAFDADNGARLWKVSLLPPGEIPSDPLTGGFQVDPEIGITSTPVIDPTTGTIYVVAMSKTATGATPTYFQRIHALDITTGAEKMAPHTIDQAISFPGSGPGGDGTDVFFNPMKYKERDALTLSDGVIYTGWASHGDTAPYTGWIIGFRASDLGVAFVLNVNPAGSPASAINLDGSGDAIWSSGNGFTVDSQGNLYNVTANGPFDTNLNAGGFPTNGDFGDTVLKLTPGVGGLSVADYFTPSIQKIMADFDHDTGSSGIVLVDIPGPGGVIEHLSISSDKIGDIYVLNRDNMGKFNSVSDNIFQEIIGGVGNGLFGSPTVYGGLVYFGGVGQPIKEYGFVDGKLQFFGQTSNAFGYPGTTTTVSSNGVTNGIVWAAENGPNAVLHAYLASDVSVELYNSSEVANGRDWFGVGNKFITPVVADGHVYVATTAGVAFGLLPAPPPTFVLPPTAGARAVVGETFTLATLASDAPYPESLLTYVWGTLSAPPGASATFGANVSNGAKTTVATVTAPGTYIFLVVVFGPTLEQVDCVTVVNVVGGARPRRPRWRPWRPPPAVRRPAAAVPAPSRGPGSAGADRPGRRPGPGAGVRRPGGRRGARGPGRGPRVVGCRADHARAPGPGGDAGARRGPPPRRPAADGTDVGPVAVGLRRQAAPCCLAGAGQAGRRRVKVVPSPGWLSARRRPLWASTISRQTERPRPVPPRPVSSGPVLVVKKGSKIRRRSAGAIPTPVSAMLTSANRPDASRPTRTRAVPPSGIAWRALMIRFRRTCWICAGLTRACGRPSARRSTRTRPLERSLAVRRRISSTSRTRSVAERRSARGRARPSTPPVIAEARWAPSRIFSKARRRNSGSGLRRPSLA